MEHIFSKLGQKRQGQQYWRVQNIVIFSIIATFVRKLE